MYADEEHHSDKRQRLRGVFPIQQSKGGFSCGGQWRGLTWGLPGLKESCERGLRLPSAQPPLLCTFINTLALPTSMQQ